jgi:hypothetical protein
MGTTFVNLQIAGVNQADVIPVLERVLGNDGWQRADEGGTRVVLVGPVLGSGWVPVFDSLLEGGDVRQAHALAAALSLETEAPCVLLAAFDGDVLDHALYRDGVQIEAGSTWPGYHEGRPQPSSPSPEEGDATRWSSLLLEGASAGELADAWRGLQVEPVIHRMARLVGWSPDWILHGSAVLPATLRRHCHAMVWQRALSSGVSAGPPVLGFCASPLDEVVVRPKDLVEIDVTANNTGGLLVGLTVVLFGAAVDQGLIRDPEVRAFVADSSTPWVKLYQPRPQDGTVWVGDFPDLKLPPGYPDLVAAVGAAGDAEGVRAWIQAQIRLQLAAIAGQVGAGDLSVGLVPVANPHQGQTAWTLTLEVGD